VVDVPLGHLGITVADLAVARAYYDALMPLVDFEPFRIGEDRVAYRPAGKPGTSIFFYPAVGAVRPSADQPGFQHLAFMVPTRSAVHDVHRFVVDRGDPVLDEPQHFPQYPQPHYATFWLDPFGLKLEAVCHYDRD
jgi:catechol 2,3-dioxygenase-like lactoylglutathione lyase family enzyme